MVAHLQPDVAKYARGSYKLISSLKRLVINSYTSQLSNDGLSFPNEKLRQPTPCQIRRMVSLQTTQIGGSWGQELWLSMVSIISTFLKKTLEKK